MPSRLEALGLAAGLPRAALHALLGAGLDAVVHLERDPRGVRRVGALHVLLRGREGLVTTEAALVQQPDGRLVGGPGLAVLLERVRRAGIEPPAVP